MMMKYVVGVDEAGRGPLAGPVAVGLAKVPAGFNWRLLPGVTDSKQLSETKREALYEAAVRLRREGKLDWRVVMPGAQQIDRHGISRVIRRAITTGLRRLELPPQQTEIRLDGLLYAPKQYSHQRTITKGDQKEKVIGLASILAKVTRDRYMVRMAAEPPYAPYDFVTHKGYGTKQHRQAIRKNGVSDIHRRSYCKNIEKL